MTETLVEGASVSKAYGVDGARVVALHDASFRAGAGDRIAVVGPSGSGKTTLLHLMAGIDVPTSGRMSWPAIGERGQLRPGPVSMAFQGPSLLPALSVLENVSFPLLLGGHREADAAERAASILHDMSLADLGPKLPEQLSGGQAQRVGLARALVTSPRLLVADEPTGQLDHDIAGEVLDFLFEHFARTDSALVVATHDPLVAARFQARWTVCDGVLATGARDA